MNHIAPAFTQIIHLALVLLAAPATAGAMGWLEARLAGHVGPSILLPWHLLVRLSRKTAVLPESASRALTLAPAVALSATICAAALVPSFTLGTAFEPLADAVVVASLLSVARVATVLGALDAGSAPSGVAAQNATALAVVAEPALLLFVFSLALMGGSFNLELVIGQQREGTLLPAAASALALIALLALVFADVCDMSEELQLDYSGIDLAVARVTVWLRRVVWIDLIGALFLPVGMAGPGDGPAEWGIGLLCWAIKLVVAIVCLAFVRALFGRASRRDMPNVAGVAALLALLATIVALAGASNS
jgi:formate hydrogenlyase subunit 4